MKPGSSRQYFLPIFSNANILKIKIIKRQHIIINCGRFLTKKRKNKKIGKNLPLYFGILYCKQQGPRSDCFLRSSPTRANNVCSHNDK